MGAVTEMLSQSREAAHRLELVAQRSRCSGSHRFLENRNARHATGGGAQEERHVPAVCLHDVSQTDGGVSGFQNFNNFRAERSLSSFDVAQRLVASYAIDLPFGRGKPVASSLSGVAGKLISGWVSKVSRRSRVGCHCG